MEISKSKVDFGSTNLTYYGFDMATITCNCKCAEIEDIELRGSVCFIWKEPRVTSDISHSLSLATCFPPQCDLLYFWSCSLFSLDNSPLVAPGCEIIKKLKKIYSLTIFLSVTQMYSM